VNLHGRSTEKWRKKWIQDTSFIQRKAGKARTIAVSDSCSSSGLCKGPRDAKTRCPLIRLLCMLLCVFVCYRLLCLLLLHTLGVYWCVFISTEHTLYEKMQVLNININTEY